MQMMASPNLYNDLLLLVDDRMNPPQICERIQLDSRIVISRFPIDQKKTLFLTKQLKKDILVVVIHF